MSIIIEHLKYTKDHEWVRIPSDDADDKNIVYIGITDYAQSQLGDIVMVELPEQGESFSKDDALGTLESPKSVSDLFSPVSGEVVEANANLDGAPELVNEDPYGDGWLVQIKMEDPSELDELMDADAYEAFLTGIDD